MQVNRSVRALLLANIVLIIAGNCKAQLPCAAGAFTKNQGQVRNVSGTPNTNVLYSFTEGDLRVHLRRNGFSYEIWQASFGPAPATELADGRPPRPSSFKVHRVDINVRSASPSVTIAASDPCEEVLNYYPTAEPADGFENIPRYSTVNYHGLLPGVDLRYSVDNIEERPTPKYLFKLAPGTDMNELRLEMSGADSLTLDGHELIIHTPLGPIVDRIPKSWVSDGSGQWPIEVHWKKHVDGSIGFVTNDPIDAAHTLFIDPAPVFDWGTYIGGSGYDEAYRVAHGPGGAAYVAGTTSSTTFIATSGAYDNTYNGGLDIYLARYQAHTGNRQWGTYHGASGNEEAWDIATASGSDVFIAARVDDDAGLLRFNHSGQLIWGRIIAGSNVDHARAVTIDATGRPIITGMTRSSDLTVTAGCHQAAYGGGPDDAFLTAFDAAGNLIYSTYVGGAGMDGAYGIAADNAGNVVISGATNSSAGIATAGAHDPTYLGADDAYLIKFNAAGARQWGTYIGTSQQEFCRRVRTINNNEFIVAGATGTLDPNGMAPIGIGSFGADVFCSRFNSSGVMQWGRVYRSSNGGDEYPMDIAISTSGGVGLVGFAYSGFPSPYPSGSSAACSNGTEGWATQLDGSTGLVVWEQCIGGSNPQFATGISCPSSDEVFICGITNTHLDMLPSGAGTQQSTIGGSWDGFLLKLVDVTVLPIELLYFDAQRQKNVVEVNWATATEKNTSHFIVERSAKDLQAFDGIGEIPAAGISHGTINYYWLDEHPIAGLAYYRLRSVDHDGQVQYSDAVAVDGNSAAPSNTPLTVYPNPTDGSFYVSGLDRSSAGTLEMFDMMGKKLRTWDVANTAQFHSGQIPQGIYRLVLHTAQQVRTGTLLVR